MSDIFELDTDGQQQLARQARENPITEDQIGSGFFTGVPKAIGMGVMRGGARAAQAVGLAGGGLLSLLDDGSGRLSDPYFKVLDDYVGNAVDYWTPRADEVGTAGRILGGFSEMALPLMATGGNPALLVGTAELGGAQDLSKQGASNKGAVAGGIIQGLATAAGFKIPFLGKTLATRMLSGVAGNVAVNAGAAGAARGALTLTGDTEQAQQFNPADWEARAVDVLTGLAFGGLAHLFAPSVRDAAATAGNAKHFQYDTAPGAPADISSSVAHQKAMEAAVRDTLAGEPVDLSDTGIDKANFVPRERAVEPFAETPEELQGVDEAIKDLPAQNPDRVDLPDEAVGGPTEAPLSDAEKPKVTPLAPGAEPEVVNPVVSSARAAVAENDFPIPTGEIDQDGRVITRSAREMLDQADQDVARAQTDSKAFEALASCILSRGNG